MILDFPRTQPDHDEEHYEEVSPPAPRRRRTGGAFFVDHGFDLAGAAIAAVSVMVLLDRLTALSGLIGLFLVAYVAFLIVFGVLVSLREDSLAVRDAVMTVFLSSAALIAFAALGNVIIYTVWRGYPALHHLNFFDQDMSRSQPTQASVMDWPYVSGRPGTKS